MSGCPVPSDELERLHRSGVCHSCHGARRECREIDVHLKQRSGIHKPLETTGVIFPGVIFRDFLKLLDPIVVSRDLYLGRVYGPANELLEQWATFHGRYQLLVRGTRNPAYRVCEECQQILYYALNNTFLYPAPPEDAEIFESQFSGLIFAARLFETLDLRPWRRKIYIDKLFVADEPLDGLGELRTW